MIIQYASDEDRLAAELIQKKIGGAIYKGYIDPATFSDSIVIVGGQIANSTYAAFVNAGVLPSLGENTPGTVFVSSYRGYNVYACAGDLRTGTIAAAEYVFLNGFPSSTTVAGNIAGLKLITIPLRNNSTLLSKTAQELDNIMGAANSLMPSGYHIDELTLSGTKLEALIRETGLALGTTAMTIVAIIIGAIVFLVGLFTGYSYLLAIGGIIAGAAALTNIFTSSTGKVIPGINDFFNAMVDAGVPAEEAAQIAYKMFKQSSFGIKEILTWATLIAAVGVGGYFLVKGFAPAIRARFAKPKEG